MCAFEYCIIIYNHDKDIYGFTIYLYYKVVLIYCIIIY